MLSLWQKSIPICIEVLLTADCECGKLLANHLDISSSSSPLNSNNSSNNGSNQQQSTLAQSNLTSCPTTTTSSSTTIQTEQLLLEQWFLTVDHRRYVIILCYLFMNFDNFYIIEVKFSLVIFIVFISCN